MNPGIDEVRNIGYGIAPSGYRLPFATRPGRVRLQIADLERSLAYYQEVLGLRVAERTGNLARLIAEGGGETLIELHERSGARPIPRRGRLGLYHYAILLPDRAALGRFVAHLRQLGVQAGASDHLVSEALYMQDPDGLGIEVYADRPRSSWTQEGPQLSMATEPLDIDSVIRAAGDAAWSGMPTGTTIGHVHLHVGDLKEAERFYHQGLGLDKIVWSYPGALFLSAGGYHHHLGLNTWAAGASQAGDEDARLLDWELLVPTRKAADGALQSLGAAGYPIRNTAEGGTALDPWGVAVTIVGNTE
jgi:catechol 2,3-dioxygenase